LTGTTGCLIATENYTARGQGWLLQPVRVARYVLLGFRHAISTSAVSPG
jgi:hypothetical protein